MFDKLLSLIAEYACNGFYNAAEKLNKFVSSTDGFADILAQIGTIPEAIAHDSTEWDVLHKNTNSALGGSSIAQSNGGALFKRRGKPLNGWSAADKRIPHEYQEWCASWAGEWLRVLKPGSSCFVFAGRRFAHRRLRRGDYRPFAA